MSDSPLSMNLYAEDWLKRPLIKVSEFIKDGTHGTHERVNIGVPLLSAKNITSYGSITIDEEDSRISNDDYQKIHSKYEIQKNDLLITVVGTLGRRALADGVHKFSIQRSVGVVRCDTTKIFPEFLYHFTGSDYFQNQLTLRSNATAQAGVYLGELAKIDIAIPPLPEQQKIATILTSVDTVIEKTRAQIDKLKHLKTGMMQQLLTQGIGHTEFKDSPVGRIPKTWEVVEFSKLAECKPKKYNPLKELKKLPCIELEHIEQESGRILGYISSSEVISIKNKFSSEDVLFSKLRPYLKKFAFPKHDGVCTSEIWVFTPRKEVTSLFLFYVVQSETFLAAANKSCGTKMPRAELDAVLETFFTKPPVKEQQKIASILQSVDDKIAAVNQKLASLEKTKKAMMQDLLTGKKLVESKAN